MSSRWKNPRGTLEDLREQISFKDLRKILEIKYYSNIIEIKYHSRTFRRFSLVEILQGSSERSIKNLPRSSRSKSFQKSLRSKFLQRPLEDLRDKSHSRIFEIKDQSRNFGRPFVSQIIPGSMDCLRDRMSSKDLRQTFGTNVIQGSSEDLGDGM